MPYMIVSGKAISGSTKKPGRNLRCYLHKAKEVRETDYDNYWNSKSDTDEERSRKFDKQLIQFSNN